MSTESAPAAMPPAPRDASHLDQDAECLEDPVHCGDAHHQHDVREQPGAQEHPPRS